MTDPTQTQSNNTDQKYTIKVGGVEKQLSLDELRELAQKGDDYQIKTTRLAEERKKVEDELKRIERWKPIIDKVDVDSKLRDTLSKVISDYESGKISKSDSVKDRDLKILDRKMAEATDSEVKESLREFRQAISEEVPVEELKAKIAELEEAIASVRSNAMVSMSDRIEKQLSEVSQKFGKDVVAKYESEVRQAAAKYPNQSVRKLFLYYASDDDAKAALLNEVRQEKDEEVKLKTNGSMTTVDTVHTKIEPPKDKRGRVDWTALTQKLKDSGRFKL